MVRVEERRAAGTAAELAAEMGFRLDGVQAEVLGRRRRRLLLNCTRQWGKSTVTAIRAVWEAVSRRGSLIVVAAPTARQSGELVEKVRMLASRLGETVRGDGLNEISAKFRNGSRIVGLPGREATIRGFSAPTLVVLDEAARIPDEVYWAVRPMMATVDADLWVLSTPFGKRGFFYEAWSAGGDDWDRVMVPATECPRIRLGLLDEERRAMGEEWVRQEYLCEFTDADSCLFDRESILRAIWEEGEPLIVARSS